MDYWYLLSNRRLFFSSFMWAADSPSGNGQSGSVQCSQSETDCVGRCLPYLISSPTCTICERCLTYLMCAKSLHGLTHMCILWVHECPYGHFLCASWFISVGAVPEKVMCDASWVCASAWLVWMCENPHEKGEQAHSFAVCVIKPHFPKRQAASLECN